MSLQWTPTPIRYIKCQQKYKRILYLGFQNNAFIILTVTYCTVPSTFRSNAALLNNKMTTDTQASWTFYMGLKPFREVLLWPRSQRTAGSFSNHQVSLSLLHLKSQSFNSFSEKTKREPQSFTRLHPPPIPSANTTLSECNQCLDLGSNAKI